MGTKELVQIIIAFTGTALAIASFWLGDMFGWSKATEINVAVATIIVTVLTELTISFVSLRESIIRLYPSLDFPIDQQRKLYALSERIEELRKRANDPAAVIALDAFASAQSTVECAYSKSDFQIDNMFQANMLALKQLRPRQRFLGLSSIINPDHWRYDPSLRTYRDLNYQKAGEGVLIYRVFLLNDENELRIMYPIMIEQLQNGINVSFVFKSEVADLSLFPDFTVLPDNEFALVVPKLEKLLTVIATSNRDTVSRLESDFDRLVRRSHGLRHPAPQRMEAAS